MSVPRPLRVLVVGDPYMPVAAYADALASLDGASLDGRVDLSTMQIGDVRHAPPRTESERRLREYVGDPADVARAVAGHDALIVHGAPVTAEVLDAAPLRLVCCARGGPVNVDVAAATDRGIPVVNTPGKNAEAVAELTIAFALLLIRAVPRASRHLIEGGGSAGSVFEGREFFGREAPGLTMGLAGLGHVGREVAWRARALGFTVVGYDPEPPDALGGHAVVPRRVLRRRRRAGPQRRHGPVRADGTGRGGGPGRGCHRDHVQRHERQALGPRQPFVPAVRPRRSGGRRPGRVRASPGGGSNEQIAVSIEDAARINASAVAVQVFIGGEFETQSVRNMTRLVDEGQRYGIPVLAVTAVGKELARDARYLRLATRICAELGAHFVKTYHCEKDFDTVAAACPVPLVMAGGKKLPELEALTMAYRAVEGGAAGVDMGRNIFQSHDPVAMIRAVGAVVHESAKPQAAYDQFFRPVPAST